MGSVAGLGCIYVLPTITHLKATYLEIKNPILSEAVKQNSFMLTQNSITKSPNISISDRFLKDKMPQSV